jgi:hemerythrin-like domain-containing protein
MSTTTHTEQMMLPGQTAAPAGPADMTLMYVMHHAFRRDLARFAEAVGATPVEDRATWKALAARWDRFFQILHHHHTVEDELIWPFLTERADTGERATLTAMEEEHGEIDPLLTSVADGFAGLAGDRTPAGAADLRAALTVRMAATRDTLGRHLEHEETGAIPILQRHTSAADWEAIEAEIDKRKPPVSLGFIVGWCADDVPPTQLDAIFAKVGLPFRILWVLTRGRFRKGERTAFAYA